MHLEPQKESFFAIIFKYLLTFNMDVQKTFGWANSYFDKMFKCWQYFKQIDLGVKVCLEYFKYLSIILIEVEWCSAMFSRCNQAKNILYLIFSIITILQFEIYQAKFCLYFEKSCEFIATPHQSNEQGWIGKRKKTWFVKKTISSPKNT